MFLKKVKLIDNFSEINNYSHVILPGIGSFKEASKIIKKEKLKIHLNKFINDGGKFFWYLSWYAANVQRKQ